MSSEKTVRLALLLLLGGVASPLSAALDYALVQGAVAYATVTNRLKTLNLGYGADGSLNCLWRLRNGELDDSRRLRNAAENEILRPLCDGHAAAHRVQRRRRLQEDRVRHAGPRRTDHPRRITRNRGPGHPRTRFGSRRQTSVRRDHLPYLDIPRSGNAETERILYNMRINMP